MGDTQNGEHPTHSTAPAAPGPMLKGLKWAHWESPELGEQTSPQLLQGLKHSIHQGVPGLPLYPVLQVPERQGQSWQRAGTRDSPPTSPRDRLRCQAWADTAPSRPRLPKGTAGGTLLISHSHPAPAPKGPTSSGHSSRSLHEAKRPSCLWGNQPDGTAQNSPVGLSQLRALTSRVRVASCFKESSKLPQSPTAWMAQLTSVMLCTRASLSCKS